MDDIKKLVDEKLTASEIGKIIGKSEWSVRRLLKKEGLKTYRHVRFDPNAISKYCIYCDKVKEVEEFPVANKIKDIIYRRNKCNDCYNLTKNNRRKGVASWLLDYKKQLACTICGNDNFIVLEFHHPNDDKEFNVSDMANTGFGKRRILKEVKKCDVLCANCHRIVTYEKRHNI